MASREDKSKYSDLSADALMARIRARIDSFHFERNSDDSDEISCKDHSKNSDLDADALLARIHAQVSSFEFKRSSDEVSVETSMQNLKETIGDDSEPGTPVSIQTCILYHLQEIFEDPNIIPLIANDVAFLNALSLKFTSENPGENLTLTGKSIYNPETRQILDRQLSEETLLFDWEEKLVVYERIGKREEVKTMEDLLRMKSENANYYRMRKRIQGYPKNDDDILKNWNESNERSRRRVAMKKIFEIESATYDEISLKDTKLKVRFSEDYKTITFNSATFESLLD